MNGISWPPEARPGPSLPNEASCLQLEHMERVSSGKLRDGVNNRFHAEGRALLRQLLDRTTARPDRASRASPNRTAAISCRGSQHARPASGENAFLTHRGRSSADMSGNPLLESLS